MGVWVGEWMNRPVVWWVLLNFKRSGINCFHQMDAPSHNLPGGREDICEQHQSG
jgi:hypothetical protein